MSQQQPEFDLSRLQPQLQPQPQLQLQLQLQPEFQQPIPEKEPEGGFTTDKGPSAQDLLRGTQVEVQVPVAGSNIRSIPKVGITIPVWDIGSHSKGYVEVTINTLNTSPITYVAAGVNIPVVTGSTFNSSINIVPLIVGLQDRLGLETVTGSAIAAKATLNVNQNTSIHIGGSITSPHSDINNLSYLGEVGGSIKIDDNTRVGVTGQVGVVDGNSSSALFVSIRRDLENRPKKTPPKAPPPKKNTEPYEKVIETKVNSPIEKQTQNITQLVVNNPRKGENVKPGVEKFDGAKLGSGSVPLYTINKKEKEKETENNVSYIYQFLYDPDPLDDQPGLMAEFSSEKTLDSSAIQRYQQDIREAEKIKNITEARKILEEKGFKNIVYLPPSPNIKKPTPTEISRQEKTNPTQVIEINGPDRTIFVSQSGDRIWVLEGGFSLTPGITPKERIAKFKEARLVTDPEEYKRLAQAILHIVKNLPNLPQPAGFRIPKNLSPDGTNNGRDDTKLPSTKPSTQPKITP